MAKIKLLPCPFCGSEVEIKGGFENWKPTFYDPDSGGDPYYISCQCGCVFSAGSQDIEEFIKAWNTRTKEGGRGEVRQYCEYCDTKECCESEPTNCKLAKRIKESKDLEQAVEKAKEALLSPLERFINWLEEKLQKR